MYNGRERKSRGGRVVKQMMFESSPAGSRKADKGKAGNSAPVEKRQQSISLTAARDENGREKGRGEE